MIKAIIFDCFGVLTTDAWLPFKNDNFGSSKEKFEEAGRLNALCDSGKIPYSQFVQMIGDMAGCAAAAVDRAISNNVVNTELFEFIEKELKGKYKLGILSNAASNWLAEMFGREKSELFDSVTLSSDIGFVKPSPETYVASLESLGITSPADCVFIDDQERFLEGAAKLGIKTIHYTDFERFKKELQAFLKADSDS